MNNKKTYNHILLIICFFVFCKNSFTQINHFNTIIELKNNKTIIKSKIDSLIFTLHNKDSLNIFHTKYAAWLYNNDYLKDAKIQSRKAIQLIKKKTIIDSILLQKNLYYLGVFNKKSNHNLKSIKYFNDALNINTYSHFATYSYFQIGIYNTKINNSLNALINFEIVFSILNSQNKNNSLMINSCLNIATICSDFEDLKYFNKGIKYALKADSLTSFDSKLFNFKYKTKLIIADLYNQHNFLDTSIAFNYYNQALQIAKKEKDTLKLFKILTSIGNLYNTSNYKKSKKYLNYSKNYINKKDTNNLIHINYNYFLTNVFNKNYKEGITYIDECLNLIFNSNINNINQFDKAKLINSNHKNLLQLYLPNIAEFYLKYYEKTNDIKYLNQSIGYYELSDYLFDIIKSNNNEFKSKLFWSKLSTETYGKAIKVCYLNNDIEQAFYFMEKNKALLLMEDLATQTYRQTLDVPIVSLEEENNLKQTILLAKNELESKITQTKIDSINKVLLDTNRELLTLQDSIYKGEKVTKKAPKILNIKEVQQNLNENEVFVEYHVSIDDGYGIYTNRENGYVVVLTKNEKYFFEINHLSILKEEVTTLINALKSPFKTNEDFSKYNTLAHTVYKKLFPTQEVRNLLKNKKVRIAPDSYLSLLPFETLITQIDKNDKLNQPNYLIKEANISYVYSYSFLKHNTFTKNENKQFLGYAPTSFKYDNLSEISNSKSEILNLKNYYNGDHFINEKATKKSFLENIENYNIIHLATHANAQDSINPWIAFKNEKLNLEELYLAKNNASLVVLSGCNTTLGKQEIGEGIMSLARGFFYGGSQSVISSLWNVDDTATPYIMNEFYKNLSHGKTKSEALHLAKLNYLDNHSLSEASPHFWASFILLGQDNVVETSFNFSWIWILGISILSVLIFIYWKKKIFKS